MTRSRRAEAVNPPGAEDTGEAEPRRAHLADLAWPEVAELVRQGAILAVPLGSTEQHGPHLPLSTDTDIAIAICERLAAARSDVLIAPPVCYGSSGEHAGFAGTLSIGQRATELVVLELGRSATETFDHIVFVCAHGGNAEAVTRAVGQLRAEGRDIALYLPRWNGDPHAGRPETAMLMAVRPSGVRLRLAVRGDTRPLTELMPHLRSGGVRAVTDTGVLGDPTGSTAADGHRLLANIAAALVRQVAVWRPEHDQRTGTDQPARAGS